MDPEHPLQALMKRRKTPHMWEGYGLATRCVHAGQAPDLVNGGVNVALCLSSTYAQESPGVTYNGYEYTRTQNPTRQACEDVIASLEGGKLGLCYASGCAATAACLSILSPGDHIISTDDVYGGTQRIWHKCATPNQQLEFTMCDTTNLENLTAAFKPNTKMVWIETPTNPTLKITDIAGAAAICKEKGVILVVDNTFGSPAIQRPLEHGATIAYNSVSKYLGGHSDVIMGHMSMNDEELYTRLKFVQNSLGACSAPFDAYMTVRGVKTLDIRMERISRNALAAAKFLEGHEKVEKVVYPGLESHPQHELAMKQMSSGSGIITFYLKGGLTESRQFLENTSMFLCAESLGAVESLLDHPAIMTHASVAPEVRAELGISDNMIRAAVGIETEEDIINDLAKGLDAVTG